MLGSNSASKRVWKNSKFFVFGAYRAAIVHFSSLYVKFSFVRLPWIMISCVISVIGHVSLIRIVIPLASDLRELKYSLCFVAC